jgi:hypothetical protein
MQTFTIRRATSGFKTETGDTMLNHFTQDFFESLFKHHKPKHVCNAIKHHCHERNVNPKDIFTTEQLLAALTDQEIINEFEARNLDDHCCDPYC